MENIIEQKLDTMIDLLKKEKEDQKILLTFDEARQKLNIGADKMRELLNKKSFPKVMNGQRYLIIASELNDWILAHKGGSL